MAKKRGPYLRPDGTLWTDILEHARTHGLSVSEVAASAGVSKAAVSQACSRYRVRLERKEPLPRTKIADWSKALVEAAVEGLGPTALAKRIGCSDAAVIYQARKHGILLPGQKECAA
jgi:hypothetical protein